MFSIIASSHNHILSTENIAIRTTYTQISSITPTHTQAVLSSSCPSPYVCFHFFLLITYYNVPHYNSIGQEEAHYDKY